MYTFRVRFRRERERERRACRLSCLSLGDDRLDLSGSRDVSQTIFTTSMNGSNSFWYLFYRILLFRRQPGLRLAFDVGKRNQSVIAFSAREVKRPAAEEREEYTSAEGQWKSK